MLPASTGRVGRCVSTVGAHSNADGGRSAVMMMVVVVLTSPVMQTRGTDVPVVSLCTCDELFTCVAGTVC